MQEFHIKQVGAEIHNPSIYGATAPCVPWPPTEDAPILLCLLLVSSILIFLGSKSVIDSH
jgi:hypothetical protein